MTITEYPGTDQRSDGDGPQLTAVEPHSVNLRLRLFMFDTAALVLAWVPIFFLGDIWGRAALVVLGAFIWLIRTVGLALVAEIKGMRGDMKAHHDLEMDHHALTREDLGEMRGSLGLPPRERSAPVRRQTQPELEVVKGGES